MFNILIDDRSTYLERTSGWERYAQELAKLSEINGVSRFSDQIRDGIVSRKLKSHGQEFLKSARFSKSFDLVHFPTIPPFPNQNIDYQKLLITLHDLTWWKYPQFSTLIGKKVYKKFTEFAINSGCEIVTVTNSMKAEIVDFFNINDCRVHVVYPGSDFVSGKYEEISERAREVNRIYSKPYILFVGTIEPRKNLQFLITAFKSSLMYGEYDLCIAGRIGWNKFKIPEWVAFFESPTDIELRNLYRNSSAVINSSFYEGFGLPLIEALALGKSVICPRLPVFKEVLGDFPIFFEPENLDSLIKVLNNFLPTPLNSMAIEYARSKFDWSTFRMETLSLYQFLILNRKN